jgi:acyl-CoA thioester hydrolase
METDTVQIRVRYAETDQMGVVYNSHFLVYFEIGRTEYLRHCGLAYRDLEAQGVYLVVVEASCRYLSPARYDDLLDISTWVSRLRPTRIDFRHRLSRKGEDAAVAGGHVVMACVDRSGRPRALPEEVTARVEVSAGPDVRETQSL